MWWCIVKLFYNPWKVLPCGCRWREYVFLPPAYEYCPQHQKEADDWIKKQPPAPPKKDDGFVLYYPID